MEIKVDNTLQVYDNTRQNIICIEEYRMKDILRDFYDSIINKPELYTSIGLFLALLGTLITADFKNLGLSAATWQAIFIILCGGAFVWLIINIVKFCRYIKNRKSINDVMLRLLSEQARQQPNQ